MKTHFQGDFSVYQFYWGKFEDTLKIRGSGSLASSLEEAKGLPYLRPYTSVNMNWALLWLKRFGPYASNIHFILVMCFGLALIAGYFRQSVLYILISCFAKKISFASYQRKNFLRQDRYLGWGLIFTKALQFGPLIPSLKEGPFEAPFHWKKFLTSSLNISVRYSATEPTIMNHNLRLYHSVSSKLCQDTIETKNPILYMVTKQSDIVCIIQFMEYSMSCLMDNKPSVSIKHVNCLHVSSPALTLQHIYWK